MILHICVSVYVYIKNHQISIWWKLEGTSVSTCSNLCPSWVIQNQLPRTMSCRFWTFLRRETLKTCWAACASAPLPAQHRSVLWCFNGTSCIPVCSPCFWFWPCAPLRRAWIHPLCTTLIIYILIRLSFVPLHIVKVIQFLDHLDDPP